MNKRTEQQTVIADEQIIELYWQRNENAIQETDKKYGQFLFGIAYNILHDRLDCEECQNDTYLGVWNAIPPTRPIAFPAFITQIMRNIAINRFKEKTSKKRIPSELTVSMDDVNGMLHSDDTVESEYEAAEVGKIINTHGVVGALKIDPWCDSPELLASLDEVYFLKNGEYVPAYAENSGRFEAHPPQAPSYARDAPS